jgi:MGT family glycosyltransferase
LAYDLPGDPLVVDYAPQLALLDRAAVAITHAGLNTVLGSISRGVPMVAMPRSADQPGNAARIAYSGAGLCASFHHGTPEELRSVIQRVLSDERFRRRAKELGQAMRSAGGVPRAADIAEEALLSRRPVLAGKQAAL